MSDDIKTEYDASMYSNFMVKIFLTFVLISKSYKYKECDWVLKKVIEK
jgi:hypothetical protein